MCCCYCCNSTFVHQCTHHKCVKWGYYCHIAGSLAAPVLITPLLQRLQALLFYLREFWQHGVCKLPSNFHSSGCHSWKPQLGFQAQVQDNEAFFHQDGLTNKPMGGTGLYEGSETTAGSFLYHQHCMLQYCDTVLREFTK